MNSAISFCICFPFSCFCSKTSNPVMQPLPWVSLLSPCKINTGSTRETHWTSKHFATNMRTSHREQLAKRLLHAPSHTEAARQIKAALTEATPLIWWIWCTWLELMMTLCWWNNQYVYIKCIDCLKGLAFSSRFMKRFSIFQLCVSVLTVRTFTNVFFTSSLNNPVQQPQPVTKSTEHTTCPHQVTSDKVSDCLANLVERLAAGDIFPARLCRELNGAKWRVCLDNVSHGQKSNMFSVRWCHGWEMPYAKV